jgi:hypothetical protein
MGGEAGRAGDPRLGDRACHPISSHACSPEFSQASMFSGPVRPVSAPEKPASRPSPDAADAVPADSTYAVPQTRAYTVSQTYESRPEDQTYAIAGSRHASADRTEMVPRTHAYAVPPIARRRPGEGPVRVPLTLPWAGGVAPHLAMAGWGHPDRTDVCRGRGGRVRRSDAARGSRTRPADYATPGRSSMVPSRRRRPTWRPVVAEPISKKVSPAAWKSCRSRAISSARR